MQAHGEHMVSVGTAVTEHTRVSLPCELPTVLEGDLADISLVTTIPLPFYVKELDNALRLVVQAGLSSAEDRILTNYLRHPQVAAKFALGDFVFITNTRPITQ